MHGPGEWSGGGGGGAGGGLKMRFTFVGLTAPSFR